MCGSIFRLEIPIYLRINCLWFMVTYNFLIRIVVRGHDYSEEHS